MDIKKIKKDSAKLAEGVWVKDIPDMGDLRLLVRGMSAPIVRDTRSRLERAVPAEERNRDGTLQSAAAMRIMGELALEAILLDWDGLSDDGKPVEYKKALAREWLTNPDYESFLDAVVWAARVVERDTTETQEAVAGN